jgi:hypothetical protein
LTLLGQIQQRKPKPQQQPEQSHILTASEEQFHSMVSMQIKRQVKQFEHKLDSVRKEREHTILLIDRAIRKLFTTTSVK